MRNYFEGQLEELNMQLTEMGKLCETAIESAIQAFFDGDVKSRERVFETDHAIDRMERDIEAMCLKLLLRQQPVAGDLRAVSSALKMISDMERIGDQAADIAEITKFLKSNNTKSKIHIYDMARASCKMVQGSVDSFVKKDLQAARAVMEYDDEVDDLFEKVKNEIIGIISADGTKGEICIDLIMIAKYLERIADHAVNIAEWVEFFLIGQHTDAP